MLKEQALRETKQKDRIVPTFKNMWSVEKLNKQNVGGAAPINRFGLHQTRYVRQTTSRDDTVVSIMSNIINENARCGRPLQIHQRMQHVAKV